ncbi:hypothetical protein DMJ13_17965 [halophilic archaeon]|nr:hypothetical protein DMJ13_17965 [halophilic archaeon]
MEATIVRLPLASILARATDRVRNNDGFSSGVEYTIRLQDGADLELTEVGVATEGDRISFSIDGRIEDIDADLLEVFSGQILEPVAVTFDTKEPEEEEADRENSGE